MAPHFAHEQISYPHYDTIVGPLRAVAHPLLFGLALAFFAGSILLCIVGLLGEAIAVLSIGFLIFGLSILIAWMGRIKCANEIKLRIEALAPHGRPHIIAHSLGTYLIGSVLRKYPDVQLGRVVLVSSVLPRKYPWKSLLSKRPACIVNVRNEYGAADLVTRLVCHLRWIFPGLGDSGVRGFQGHADTLHSSDNAIAACTLCNTTPARIHNVSLEEFGHSDGLLGYGHARKLWLPILWGFPPEEWLAYLEMCREAADLEESQQWTQLDLKIDALWSGKFSWTYDLTLADFVRNLIIARGKREPLPAGMSTEYVVGEIQSLLHTVVMEALANPQPGNRSVAFLNPEKGITEAIERVVKGAPNSAP